MSRLLSSSVSVTRFNATVPSEGPDFERIRFWSIEPGSEVRERIGVVPFELDAPYEVGQGRYAFRVRIDRIRADTTAAFRAGRVLHECDRFGKQVSRTGDAAVEDSPCSAS